MLKVGGVTKSENARCYSAVIYPGAPDTAGSSSADFTCMADDLSKLAHAYEVKLRNATVNNGIPLPPIALPFVVESRSPNVLGYDQKITIKPTRDLGELKDGYIAIIFRGIPRQVGTDLVGSKYISSSDDLKNQYLVQLLSRKGSEPLVYVVQIGQKSVNPTNPLHVFVGGKDIGIDSVVYFQERY